MDPENLLSAEVSANYQGCTIMQNAENEWTVCCEIFDNFIGWINEILTHCLFKRKKN